MCKFGRTFKNIKFSIWKQIKIVNLHSRLAPYGWLMKIIRLEQRSDILTATCWDVSGFLVAFTDADQLRLTGSFLVYVYTIEFQYKCASPSCHKICNKRSTSARKFYYVHMKPATESIYIVVVYYVNCRYNQHCARRNLLITTNSCSDHPTNTLCPIVNYFKKKSK